MNIFSRRQPYFAKRSDGYWALASVFVVAIVLPLHYLLQHVRVCDEQVQDVTHTETIIDAQDRIQALRQTSLTVSPAIKKMQVSSVELPPVPPPLQARSPLAVEPTASLAHAQIPTVNNVSKMHSKYGERSLPVDAMTSSNTPMQSVSQLQVARTMRDMAGSQLQITMPKTAHEQHRLNAFLYNCVGIGLGALINRNAVPEVMPLTALPNNPSTLLRRVTGTISAKERQLQSAYAPGEALLRIYPQQFDMILSRHIASHLHGASLSAFLAQYRLTQQRLYIENIRINGEALNSNWLLFDGHSADCRL
jgi:hypothetical protein